MLSNASMTLDINGLHARTGGPPSGLEAIFANVEGSELSTGSSYAGYWTAPCDVLRSTNVSIVLAGIAYPLDPRDINLGTLANRSMCVA